MQVLNAPIEDFILGEKTSLRENISEGVTSIPVASSKGYENDQFIIIGEVGSESTELAQISDTIEDDVDKLEISSVTEFEHKKGVEIRRIRYNKRKFYRAEEKDGTYIQINNSPVEIEVDQTFTEVEDANGTSSSWYKATYYNDFTQTETSLDSAAASKAGDTDHYTSINKIIEEAGFEDNSYLETSIVSRYRDEAEAEVNSAIAGIYDVPIIESSKLLQRIVTLLAAGYLLKKEYAMEGDSDIGRSGTPKIERANELIEKIKEGDYTLVNQDGVVLKKGNEILASSSNEFSSSRIDKGDMFNLRDEHFKFTNPDDPLADSKR